MVRSSLTISFAAFVEPTPNRCFHFTRHVVVAVTHFCRFGNQVTVVVLRGFLDTNSAQFVTFDLYLPKRFDGRDWWTHDVQPRQLKGIFIHISRQVPSSADVV